MFVQHIGKFIDGLWLIMYNTLIIYAMRSYWILYDSNYKIFKSKWEKGRK